MKKMQYKVKTTKKITKYIGFDLAPYLNKDREIFFTTNRI